MEVNTFVQGKTTILKTFSVKGYKSWTGREGVGAQATLYKDGKKIGLVTDEGNGGGVSLIGSSSDNWKMVKDFLDALPEYQYADMWLEQFGETWDGSGAILKSDLISWTLDEFADVMLNRAEENHQLRNACKKNILVRFDGENTFKVFDSEWPKNKVEQKAIMDQIKKQVQPQTIAEFVNNRFSR